MNAPAKIKEEPATPVTAKGDIHVRMVDILRDLDAIGKNAKNVQQGFNYRGIDDVYNAINPLLAKHGVFMTAEVVGKTREERTNAKGTVLAFTCLHMRYHFIATDGTSVTTEAEGEGMDSGDKSSNKAMAVAHKYALLQAFCVPTKDLEDPDMESHEVAAKPAQTQREVIHTLKTPTQDDTSEQDREVQEGAKNWANNQKHILAKATRLPDLLMWLDEHGGDWVKPANGSTLYRLKRKAPDAFNDLKDYYQTVQKHINQNSQKEAAE